MACVCCASLGIGQSSQPTFNRCPLQHFSDMGIQTIGQKFSGKISRQNAAMPTSKSLAKFRAFDSKSRGYAIKGANGFGKKTKRIVRMAEEEDRNEVKNYGGDGEGEGEDNDDEIPEVVFNRMMKRIGFFVGGPILLGFLLFPCFDFLKNGLKINIPVWLPLATTFVTFGSSSLGIVYGAVSASWDPEKEGSLLGWAEMEKNWPEVWKSDQAAEVGK